MMQLQPLDTVSADRVSLRLLLPKPFITCWQPIVSHVHRIRGNVDKHLRVRPCVESKMAQRIHPSSL